MVATVTVKFDNGEERQYYQEPCNLDCYGDGLPTVHYHQVNGDDMIEKSM